MKYKFSSKTVSCLLVDLKVALFVRILNIVKILLFKITPDNESFVKEEKGYDTNKNNKNDENKINIRKIIRSICYCSCSRN